MPVADVDDFYKDEGIKVLRWKYGRVRNVEAYYLCDKEGKILVEDFWCLGFGNLDSVKLYCEKLGVTFTIDETYSSAGAGRGVG